MDTDLHRFLQYLRFERGYAANTLAAYERDLMQCQEFMQASGLTQWSALRPVVLEDFLASLQDHGYSTATVGRKVAAARSFLHFLFAEGVIESELVDWLHQPKVGKRLPHTLSREAVQRLLDAASVEETPLALRDRALLEMLYATGMRASEILSLRVGDVDLANNTVLCMGKGSKERIVPISSVTADLICKYLYKNPHIKNSRYLFATGSKQGYKSVHNLESTFRRLCKKLGIPRITPHMLRHYFATYTLRN